MLTATGKSERKHVAPELFIDTCIDVYEAGGTIAEVAEKLGMKEGSVAQRILKYRSEYGISLPHFARKEKVGAPKLDVRAMQEKLAARLGKSVEEIVAEGNALVEAHRQRQAAAATS